MNRDEFCERARCIAEIEQEISRLQERMHLLYIEIAHQAYRGLDETTPDSQIPRQTTATTRSTLTKR